MRSYGVYVESDQKGRIPPKEWKTDLCTWKNGSSRKKAPLRGQGTDYTLGEKEG